MAKAKLAITLDRKLLNDIDALIAEHRFANRSQAIESAVAEKLARLARTRLAQAFAVHGANWSSATRPALPAT